MEDVNATEMNIRLYLPNLITLGGDDVLDWKTCDDTFNEIRNRHSKSGQEGQFIEANVYEVILALMLGHQQAYRFIDFFNQILGLLSKELDDIGRHKIKAILKNIFTAHDHKFLNFIGELIVLYKLLNSKRYLLNNVEVEIPNKKRIDFELVNLNQGRKMELLEVHNVHLDDDKVEDFDDKLFQFFKKRRKDKIDETKAGLAIDMEIQFMQVYWGGAKSMRTYASFFKRHEKLRDFEPIGFSTTFDIRTPEKFTHRFGRLHEIFID